MFVKTLLWVIYGLITATIGLVGIQYIQCATQKDPLYVLGDSILLTAEDSPRVSSKALLSWATAAATACFSIDFVHYDDTLNKIRPYFTNHGYAAFLDNTAAFLNQVRDKKLDVNAVATNHAIIVEEGLLFGTYTWGIQIPLSVQYTTAGAEKHENYIIQMKVNQVSTTEAPNGIGITEFIASPNNMDIS
jgi:hypothetical protein